MDELIVQPVGGVVGAGENSNIKSEGRMPMSALSPSDQARVEQLFSTPPAPAANFQYRITRQGPNGTKTVNAPADAVPDALIQSIRTELK